MTPTRCAVERHVVVPARAVEHRAREVVDALDVGVPRMVQHAGRGDDDVDLVVVPGRGLELPAAVDELAARDLVAEADASLEAVLARDPLEVARGSPGPGENWWLQSGFGAKEYE